MTDFKVAVPLQMSLGESPLWDYRQQRLHWIDIHAGVIYSWQPGEKQAPQSTRLSEQIGCLALAENGGLLAATASGVWLLDANHQRELAVAKNPEWHNGRGNRFNDGGIDPLQRLWVGTLDQEEANPTAALYCLGNDGLSRQKEGVVISNGLAFSPAGDWLYHTDSPQRRVLRHAFDLTTGAMGPGHVWIDLDAYDLPGVVDGAAVDSLGRYWCALYGGGQVACFSPAGEYLYSFWVACPHPTMVAFGGADLRTLFVTTARQHLQPEELSRYPDAGSLLSMPVDIPGLPQQIFAGIDPAR